MGNKHAKPQNHQENHLSQRVTNFQNVNSQSQQKQLSQSTLTQSTTQRRRSLRNQKMQHHREDYLHVSAELLGMITTFLDIRDITNLMVCNLRLYSLIGGNWIGIAYNFHYTHLIIPEQRWEHNGLKLQSMMLRLSQKTDIDWCKMFKKENAIYKTFQSTGNNVPRTLLQTLLPALRSESMNDCAVTPFQLQAQKNLLKIVSNVEDFQSFEDLSMYSLEYIALGRDIVNIPSRKLQQLKKVLDVNLPPVLQNFIIIRLKMDLKCDYYHKLLIEATKLEDKLLSLQLVNVCWNQFVHTFIDEGNHAFQMVNKFIGSESGSKTFNDIMITDWSTLVITEELAAYLVSSFSDLLFSFRKQSMLQECTKEIINAATTSQWSQVLQRTFSVFVDLSTTSSNVVKLGSKDFEGNQLFKDCIGISNVYTSNLYEFCEANFNGDLERAISLFQHDATLVRQIFSAWVVQDSIEFNHIKYQKLLLKSFLKQQHQQVNFLKVVDFDDEEKDRMFSSAILSLSEINQSCFDAKNYLIESKFCQEEDLLMLLIQESIQEIQGTKEKDLEDEKENANNSLRVSDYSTQCSSLGSSIFGANDKISDMSDKIAAYVRKHHPFVSDLVSKIQKQEVQLSYQTEQRLFQLERSSIRIQNKSFCQSQTFTISQMIQAEINDLSN